MCLRLFFLINPASTFMVELSLWVVVKEARVRSRSLTEREPTMFSSSSSKGWKRCAFDCEKNVERRFSDDARNERPTWYPAWGRSKHWKCWKFRRGLINTEDISSERAARFPFAKRARNFPYIERWALRMVPDSLRAKTDQMFTDFLTKSLFSRTFFSLFTIRCSNLMKLSTRTKKTSPHEF